jgi:hypothetical protein
MRCCDCGADVGEPDIGDNRKGGTPVAIGMVVCSACLRERNDEETADLARRAVEDSQHQFSIRLGGTTVHCDDRDDTPAHLE